MTWSVLTDVLYGCTGVGNIQKGIQLIVLRKQDGNVNFCLTQSIKEKIFCLKVLHRRVCSQHCRICLC